MARKPVQFRTFTPDEQTFLRAIHEAPRDFTLRRIYGDWLKERDDPLGEFIHLQVMEHLNKEKPPRGTKTRIREMERQHGMSWRGAPTDRHRRFASGAFFEFFIWGLPDVTLFVGSDDDALEKLDTALALGAPHHQLQIILDFELNRTEDLRWLFRHRAFSLAHIVELRRTVCQQHSGVFSFGTVDANHVRQAMECWGQRPFRFLSFHGVPRYLQAEVEQFQAAAKTTVHWC